MSYDPSTDSSLARVRLLIGDRGAGMSPAMPEVFSDAEIQLAITMAGSEDDSGLYSAAATLCHVMATEQSRFAIAWSVMAQDASIDRRSVARELRLRADRMSQLADENADGGSIAWSDANVADFLDSLTQAGIHDLQHQEDRSTAS